MSNGRGPQGMYPSAGRVSVTGTDHAAALRQAMAFQQQGRLAEAERLCREVLKGAPSNPDALHFLGLLEAQQGRHESALSLIDRAVVLNPGNAAAHYNKGNVLNSLARREEALAAYDRALKLKPDHIAAELHRAAILYQLERHTEALASCDRALKFKPNHADALIHRGNILVELDRCEAALDSFNTALRASPRHAAALYGRGNAEAAMKHYAEAIASYTAALEMASDNVDVLNNRGIAWMQRGKHEEAVADFCHAISVAPERPDSFVNRGNVLLRRQQYEDALKDFSHALALRPDYAEALFGRGHVLLELKRYEEAIASFDRLHQVRPDYPFAPGMLLHAKRSLCDWTGEAALVSQIVTGLREGHPVTSPLALLAVSDSAQDNADCARILARNRGLSSPPPWEGPRYAHDRLRIAYVSSDFHTHAVALLMAGVFEQHDRTRFETLAVSYGPDDNSAMRNRLRRAFDSFLDVRSVQDQEIAKLIRTSEIDIAIDLKGYTGDARPAIFATRPAPIQINFLGFPGTMGTKCYDYILADRIVIPEEQRAHYDESVVYLPNSYLPHDRQRIIATPAPVRTDCGLPAEGFVFCCFNATYKIGVDTFEVWMRLLREVEDSVLWLSAAPVGAVRNLRHEAEARGIAGERLIFASFAPTNEAHLARLSCADLFLDTMPYNAHSTASDALWAELPVLTCAGESFAGRVGASLLHAAGLPELVTGSLAEYEVLALRLARDTARLGEIRSKLKANRETAPLFDTSRFARDLEAAYTAMHARFHEGERLAPFAIAPQTPSP